MQQKLSDVSQAADRCTAAEDILQSKQRKTQSSAVTQDLSFDLTEREWEIAQLAADGLRNNEIAKMLFVSENTVRAHLRTIFQKLDIDRRANLVKVIKQSKRTSGNNPCF